MVPQFVDFNADGHLDIVLGTYDGSPHVAYGSASGFHDPEFIDDGEGNIIELFETRDEDHFISAVAFDWDNDGDYDLLLGSYHGLLMRRVNEGSNSSPKFSSENIPVMAGEEPFNQEGGMTAPDLIDWNGDGLLDMVCGAFGGQFGQGASGGVYLYKNTGELGAPSFGPAITLIASTAEVKTRMTPPNEGLYVDVVDYNEDGEWDLLVGGYSNYFPEPRPHSEEEKQRINELDEQLSELNKQRSKLAQEAFQEAENREERRTISGQLELDEEYRELTRKIGDAQAERRLFNPGQKREPAVWLFLGKKK